MVRVKRDRFDSILALALVSVVMPAMAQPLSGPPADPQYKYSLVVTRGTLARLLKTDEDLS